MPRRSAVSIWTAVFLTWAVTGSGDGRAPGSGPQNRSEPGVRLPGEAYAGEEEVPELTEESTIADYLVYAALKNPGLRAAFQRWRAAVERIPQMTALPDPRFTYGYYVREVETRAGAQEQRFSLSQTFPWFGKLDLRGDAAAEAANAERARFEAAKLGLFYRVQEAYAEYYYLSRAIAVTEENVELVTYFESVARTRYKAGATPHASIIRAQVELGKLEDRLRTLRDLRNPIAAKLNAALSRPSEAALPWPKELATEEATFTDEELRQRLREANPELAAIASTAEKERINAMLARKEYYPDISVGVDYIETNDAFMRGVDESGKDAVVAMFSINLPIWQGKYRAAEREAKARHEAALEELADRGNSLGAGLEMALYRFRDAERKIDLYGDTLVPKAEQSLEVSQQGFAAGEVDFLDLIDAERILLEFQLSYERALADRAQRLAEIEALVGERIRRPEAEIPQPLQTEGSKR